MNNQKVIKLTMTALMAAILCVIAPIAIPVPFGTVPISLATFAAYLSGGVLGEKLGSVSVLIYILLGMVGVPVFAGWSAGASIVLGPTGGYLFGYIIIAYCTGIFSRKLKGNVKRLILGMIIGTLGCYLLGTVWLGLQLHMSVGAALLAGVIPFIPGDIIKMIVAVVIILPLRKQVTLSTVN